MIEQLFILLEEFRLDFLVHPEFAPRLEDKYLVAPYAHFSAVRFQQPVYINKILEVYSHAADFRKELFALRTGADKSDFISATWIINADMPAGVWYRVQLPMSSHAKPFGMVSAENVLEKVTVNISGSGPITVYVDSFIVA